MPSSYSTNLKIELQATGENSGTWGTITNTNLGTALEQAVVGYGNPSYPSDANLTLTYTDTNAAQAARALVLNVTSAVSLSATRELVVPTIQKQYIVQNNTSGSQSITVKTSAGTGITVPNGRKAHLYVNGTDVIFMDDYVDINGGTIDGTTIGANSAAAGNFTTVDTTNIEVTNLKAKDGTTAGSIADATGVVTLGSSVLTTTDINGGTIDGTTIGGSSAAAGTFTTLTTSSTVTLNGGTANGVLYLNGSKVATSGTAFTFSGTAFSVGDGSTQSVQNINGGATGGAIKGQRAGVNQWFLGDTAAALGSGTGLINFLYGADPFIWYASSAELMRLTTTGLGIGTASPVGKLQVTGSLASFILNTSGTEFYNNYAGQVKIYTSNAAGFLSFGSGGRDNDVVLSTTGNVGIGTASPGEKLTVAATANNAGKFTSTATTTALVLDNTNANGWGSNLAIQTGGTAAGYFGTIGSLLGNTTQDLAVYANTGNGFRIYTNGNNLRATLDASGNLGLGVTPSAWSGYGPALQMQYGAIKASYFSSTNNQISVLNNAFEAADTSYKYIVSTNKASMYKQIEGAHQWHTAAGGTAGNTISFTQAMTLDASGNLALGSTSVTSGSRLYISGGKLNVSTGSTGAQIQLASWDVLGYSGASSNEVDVGGITAGQYQTLKFWSAGSERARITSGGDLLVNNTATIGNCRVEITDSGNSEQLLISGANQTGIQIKNATGGNGWIVGRSLSANNANDFFIFDHANSTNRLLISTDGEVRIAGDTDQGAYNLQVNGTGVWGAGAYVNGSDERLKDNIQSLDSGLDVVKAMRAVTFQYKPEHSKDQSVQPGFIAQELQQAMAGKPYLEGVVQAGPEYLNVAYQNIIPILVKAIQELEAKVAALESK